jgi:hypothetical protein
MRLRKHPAQALLAERYLRTDDRDYPARMPRLSDPGSGTATPPGPTARWAPVFRIRPRVCRPS